MSRSSRGELCSLTLVVLVTLFSPCVVPLEKRSVAVSKVDDIVAEIEQQLHERAEKEIKWDELGEMVMEQLKKLDQVAYVRFSSVYRQFQDVSQFSDTVAQLKGLLKDDKPKPVGAPRRPRPLSRTK